MELLKKPVQTIGRKTKRYVQTTLDKDMNVPDSKPDMEKLIQNKGMIQLEEVEAMKDRIRIKGILLYKGLYRTAEAGSILGALEGSFELEEYINAEGISAGDSVKVTAELDDLNVMMIHSRKLGIRALITFQAFAEERTLLEGATGTLEEDVQQLFSELHMTRQVFHKKDTCRVKGEMTLAASKPNIYELIWDEFSLRNPEVRMLDRKMKIRGEMNVFFLYRTAEERVPIQYMEWEMPFEAEIECQECEEGMIGQVDLMPGFCQLEIKPDEDGEERIVSMNGILNLDMKGYEEEKSVFLSDIYSTERELEPVYTSFQYENLIVKNNAKTKVQRKVSLKGVKGKVLQLIRTDAVVKLDETELKEEGIYVEGVVLADLLLITDEDYYPLCGATHPIPFSYLIEAKNLKEEDRFHLEAGLEQIHGTMMDGEELELKAVISLNVIAFSSKEGKLITEVKESPFSYEKLKRIPGIGVYIAEVEEPVWNVAKKYCSTVESIKQMNQLDSEILKPGQKVLITKKVREVL